LCDSLIYVNRNLTLNLPEDLIHKLRVHAAEKNLSMTTVARQAIELVLTGDWETERKAAAKRLIARMRSSPGYGLTGKIPWTRDEIHER
jgi:plasmid stability protein